MARRVRASSIKLLPAAADDAVASALDAVLTRQSLTQTAALQELNARLGPLGIDPIAMSTFNRLVVQCRDDGIPQRYQLARSNDDTTPGVLDGLLALIDSRIDAALDRRRGAGVRR